MNPQYLNAKQIFQAYVIPRAALQQLVSEGRLSVREFSTQLATMKLYSVEDLEKIINGERANA